HRRHARPARRIAERRAHAHAARLPALSVRGALFERSLVTAVAVRLTHLTTRIGRVAWRGTAVDDARFLLDDNVGIERRVRRLARRTARAVAASSRAPRPGRAGAAAAAIDQRSIIAERARRDRKVVPEDLGAGKKHK